MHGNQADSSCRLKSNHQLLPEMTNLIITSGVYEALNSLSKAMRRKILEAVMQYQFEGIEPENFSTTARVIFRLIIACSRQAEETMRPKDESLPEAVELTETEPEPAEEAMQKSETESAEAVNAPAVKTTADSTAATPIIGLNRSERRRLRRSLARLNK